MKLKLISNSDFFDLLQSNISKNYRISSSSSTSDEFIVSGGIIESVYVLDESLFIESNEGHSEKFTFSVIDKFEVNQSQDTFKITYKDGSYLKIFIN